MKFPRLLLYPLFIISFLCCSADTRSLDIPALLAQAVEGKTIELKNISVLQILPLSPGLKNFLNTISLVTPVVADENPQAYQAPFSIITAVKSITAQATVEGVTVNAKVLLFDQVDGQKIAVQVQLPQGFSYAQWEPSLAGFSDLVITDASLLVAQTSYSDPIMKTMISEGVSFQLTIAAAGKIKELLDHLGISGEVLSVAGTIRSGLFGSSFTCSLGDSTVLLGNQGQIGNAHGLSLVLTLIEMMPGIPGISAAVQGNLAVTFPWQQEPLSLMGEFKYISPTLLSISGWMGAMYGPPAFGIPGLALGEFGVSAGLDVAEASTTAGTLSLAEVGYAGSIMLGKTTVSLEGQLNYSANPDLILIGSVGPIDLKELIIFGSDIIDRASGNAYHVAQQANELLPALTLDKAMIYVIPKDTTFLGVYYPKGIQALLTTTIANVATALTMQFTQESIQATGQLTGLQLGSVKITGDPTSATPNTAQVSLAITPSPFSAGLLIEGGIELNVLGGIREAATLALTTSSISCHLAASLWKTFDADVRLAIPFTATAGLHNLIVNDAAIGLDVSFKQTGVEKFDQQMRQHTTRFHEQAPIVQKLFQEKQKITATIAEKETQLQFLLQKNSVDAQAHAVILQAELAALHVALENVQLLLDAIGWNIALFDELAPIVAYIVQHGLVVTSMQFNCSVADLKRDILPMIHFDVLLDGNPFSFSCAVDFTDLKSTWVTFIRMIEDLVGIPPIS